MSNHTVYLSEALEERLAAHRAHVNLSGLLRDALTARLDHLDRLDRIVAEYAAALGGASYPQTEAEARTCVHGNRYWYGHECGLCEDGEPC